MESSPSNIRINLRNDDEILRTRPIPAAYISRDNIVSRIDVVQRNRSLSQSYFETEREEDLYEN